MSWDIISMGIANIFLPAGMFIMLWSIDKNSLSLLLVGLFMILVGGIGLILSLRFVREERKHLLEKEKNKMRGKESKIESVN